VFQAHTPWSDNNIYFDTAGCCDTSLQRLSANIDTFSGYTGNNTWWTTLWHNLVFTKKADVKQIWIDGELFLEGNNTGTLSTDINQLMVGSDNASGGLMHSLVDDFAVYGKALQQAQITALKSGTKPSALPTTVGLIAYWDFNTVPAVPPTLSIERSGASLVITFTGTLQSSSAITGGTWTDVQGTSPLTVSPTGTTFYRAKQ
jgi:hypothetical protein